MASNLDYLDPSLRPLEEKIQAYLHAEKELQQAEREVTMQTHESSSPTSGFDQRPPAGSYSQHLAESRNALQNLRDDLTRLRHDILQLLPVRDEWVKVNLGYGPSRVGAFRTGTTGTDADYDLRVVF